MVKALSCGMLSLLLLAVLAASQARPLIPGPANEDAGPFTRLVEEYSLTPEQADALVTIWSGEGVVEVWSKGLSSRQDVVLGYETVFVLHVA